MAISRSKASSKTSSKTTSKTSSKSSGSSIGISTKPNTNSIGISVPTKSSGMTFKVGQGLNSAQTVKANQVISKAAQPIGSVKTPISQNLSTVGSNISSGVKNTVNNVANTAKNTISNVGNKISSVTRSSGGGSNKSSNLAGSYSALQDFAGGGGDTSYVGSTSGESYSDTPSDPYEGYSATTYGGSPGIEKISYSSTAPKGSTPTSTVSNPQAYQDREAQRQMIAQAEAEKQASITNLQGQLSALTTQFQETKANEDRFPVSLDEFGNPVAKESDNIAKQLQALENSLQEASQDSPEVLAAKQEEDRLIAEEANIKAGLSGSVAEVKDQPIPFGFITGQQSALENRANAKLEGIAASRIPLQMRLANLQQKKQAALDLVRSKIATTKDERDYLRQSEKEKRQRGYQLTDQATERAREDQKIKMEQDNINKKFEEDKRRFGLEYAQKARQINIDQMNANTNKYKAENPKNSGLSLPEGWE